MSQVAEFSFTEHKFQNQDENAQLEKRMTRSASKATASKQRRASDGHLGLALPPGHKSKSDDVPLHAVSTDKENIPWDPHSVRE